MAIGDAMTVNGLTIAVLVAGSLGVAQLLLRLPPSAARQVPISVLVVLTSVASTRETFGWGRGAEAVIGGIVGVVIALVLPGSRVVDAAQTLRRLRDGLAEALETMGAGVQVAWSTEQTEAWRRSARIARDRLVDEAAEAMGTGREVARWNLRDRRQAGSLSRYEQVLPRLEQDRDRGVGDRPSPRCACPRRRRGTSALCPASGRSW